MARLAPLLVTLALALLLPTAASAAWLPIEEIGTIERDYPQLRLAANDRGDAVSLMGDSGGLQVAVSRRGGPFGPARKVPGSEGAHLADVLVNQDGRALIHWRVFPADGGERLYIVGLKIDGGFGNTREVTPLVDHLLADPVIGPRGRFVFVYVDRSRLEHVYARVAPPSGKLGPRTKIVNGTAWVRGVWYVGNQPYIAYTQESEGHRKLRERRIGGGGPSRVIANLPARSTLVLDTASNGAQAALATGSPLLAAVRRPGGVFKWQRLETDFAPEELDVAVARTGAATAVWGDWLEPPINDEPSPTPWPAGEMYTAYRPAGGSFGEVRTFRPDPEPSRNTGLVADMTSRGTAILSWGGTRFNGIRYRMFVAVQRAGGKPAVRAVTDFDEGGGPSAKIDEEGRTVVTWLAGTRVRAMRGSFGR